MRLAKTDIIAGLEAPVVRDLMRRIRNPGNVDYLRSRFPAGVDAATVAEQLVAEGLLEQDHPRGDSWCKPPPKAMPWPWPASANPSPGPPPTGS